MEDLRAAGGRAGVSERERERERVKRGRERREGGFSKRHRRE